MSPRLRKLVLTTHVTISVGWLGAVAAYVALAIAALASGNAALVRASQLSMELMGWFVIVWLAVGALLTGVVQALLTEWGLLRHYWIVVKLVLTVIATAVLFKHMPTVSRVAAGEQGIPPAMLLVHAAGGLVVLTAITTISIFKPWGKTRAARQKQG